MILGLAEDSAPDSDFSTIPDVSVSTVADRVQPRQVATGVTRGTWRIVNTDGSYITIGEIPNSNGEFGVAFFDENDNLIKKDIGKTMFNYDAATNKNYLQLGTLPDGTGGITIATTGNNVADIYTL